MVTSCVLLRPRNGELWIVDDALRIGDYKLLTGVGASQTSNGGCSLLGDPLTLPDAALQLGYDGCDFPAREHRVLWHRQVPQTAAADAFVESCLLGSLMDHRVFWNNIAV